MQKHPKAWANELSNYINRAHFERGKGVSKRTSRENSDDDHRVHGKKTRKNYSADIRQFANFLHEKGVTDVLKIKPAHSEEFLRTQIEKRLSASTLNSKKQAIVKLQNAVAHEKGRKKVTMIDDEKTAEMLKAAQKIRHADPRHADRKKGAIITQNEATTIEKTLASSRSPNAKAAAGIEKMQTLTGARVSEAFSIKAGDVNVEGNAIKFKESKGGKTRVIHVDDETAQLFADLKRGKKDNTPLFTFRDHNGQIVAKDEAARSYHRLIKNARNQAGLGRESGAQITSHSFRKVYANELAQKLREAPLERVIQGARMLSNNPSFKKKLNDMTGGRITASNRWKAEQMIVSHTLGHNRRDVLAFYLSDRSH